MPEGKTMGMPLIKTEPDVTGDIKNGDCALISFRLIEKQGKYIGLVPDSITVEQTTNDQLAQAVRRAVSRWMYSTKQHKAGDLLYYSYVVNTDDLCQRNKSSYEYVASGKCVQTSDPKTGKTVCASGETLKAAINAAKLDYETACRNSSGTLNGNRRNSGDIKRSINSQIGKVYARYNKALRADPSLQGKFSVKIVIAPSGKVISSSIVKSGLGDKNLEDSLLKIFSSMQFSEDGGDITSFNYTMDFIPQ
jgi:hypothetical protein